MEREENYEPRLLDPPLPQGAATVGYVAAGAPLLVVPTLHGDDGIDGTTNLKRGEGEEAEVEGGCGVRDAHVGR